MLNLIFFIYIESNEYLRLIFFLLEGKSLHFANIVFFLFECNGLPHYIKQNLFFLFVSFAVRHFFMNKVELVAVDVDYILSSLDEFPHKQRRHY